MLGEISPSRGMFCLLQDENSPLALASLLSPRLGSIFRLTRRSGGSAESTRPGSGIREASIGVDAKSAIGR